MKKAFSSSLATLFLACITSIGHAQDVRPTKVAELQKRARKLAVDAEMKTVCVLALAGSGSGAVISKDGRIVTNAHVGALSPYAIMGFADGRKILAKRLGIDYQYDLAHYKLIGPGSEGDWDHYDIAEASPGLNRWVAGIGYPGGPKVNSKPSFSLGVTQKPGSGPRLVNGVLDYTDAIVSDVPLFPGNSGGPMVSLENGQLLGINGAVNLAGGASFTIPIERVKKRVARLNGQVFLLPGNVAIDRNKYAFLKPAFTQFDNFVLQQMQNRLRQSGRARSSSPRSGQIFKAPPAKFLESDMLALRARKTSRNTKLVKANNKALEAAKSVTLRLKDQSGRFLAYGTRIDSQRVVAMTRKLAGRSVFYLETADGQNAGRAEIESSDKGTGLSALRVSVKGATIAASRYNPSKQIGRLIFTYAPRKVAGKMSSGALAGVISCAKRPISRAREIARAGAGDTTPKPVRQFLRLIIQFARTFKISELEDLVKQIEGASKLRQNYMRGSLPRGFKNIFTHDLPLAPSEVGTAIVDNKGRLVGINVSNAHYGSSYAVGVKQLNKIFKLGKSSNKRAKLY